MGKIRPSLCQLVRFHLENENGVGGAGPGAGAVIAGWW